MNSNYQFKRLEENMMPKLVSLFQIAFKKPIKEEILYNKFQTANYTGKGYIAFVALDIEENVVALYAIYPFWANLDGKEFLFGQVGDLMTHPNHQRQGLFLILGTLSHKLAKDEGLKFIFTFPFGKNPSYQGFDKHLGFTSQKMNTFKISVKSIPFCRWAHKSPATLSVYNFYIKLLIGFFYYKDNMFGEQYAVKHDAIIKNEKFFKYKFHYSTGWILKLMNSKVFLKVTKYGMISIGDFEHYIQVGKTITQLKRFCFFAGIRSIRFEVIGNNKLNSYLKEHYPLENDYYVSVLKLEETLNIDNFNFVFGDFDNF